MLKYLNIHYMCILCVHLCGNTVLVIFSYVASYVHGYIILLKRNYVVTCVYYLVNYFKSIMYIVAK